MLLAIPSLRLRNFNSIKVQLEPTADTSGTQVSPFQFHKGTIRTDIPG